MSLAHTIQGAVPQCHKGVVHKFGNIVHGKMCEQVDEEVCQKGQCHPLTKQECRHLPMEHCWPMVDRQEQCGMFRGERLTPRLQKPVAPTLTSRSNNLYLMRSVKISRTMSLVRLASTCRRRLMNRNLIKCPSPAIYWSMPCSAWWPTGRSTS